MKHLCFAAIAALLAGLVFTPSIAAQSRDEKVRSDRDNLIKDLTWFYDDLDKGLAVAKRKNKPLMVVLRCIP